MSKDPSDNQRRIINKKARHDYHILATLEAGIALVGSEVKSLRAGQAQLTDSFVQIHGNQATLIGAQIDRYPPATDRNHDPQRKRRLLLHKRELRKLEPQLATKGTTLIPLSIYFSDRGLAKVELAVALGKKTFDKRQDLRKKEHQRDIDRALRRR